MLDEKLIVSYARSAGQQAGELKSNITGILPIIGMSGVMGRHLMNNLCSFPGLKYLEVGVWKGSMFCSAMFGNDVTAIGIDDWSEFEGPREECVQNIGKYHGRSRARLISQDAFTVEPDKITSDGLKVDVYFYDGGHSENDQYRAFSHFDPVFSDTFIAVVDDWEQLDVQKGTLYAIRDIGYDVLWDNHYRSVDRDVDRWWCGMYVAVLRKKKGQ